MTGRNILCMAFMDALLIFLLFPQILYELWEKKNKVESVETIERSEQF